MKCTSSYYVKEVTFLNSIDKCVSNQSSVYLGIRNSDGARVAVKALDLHENYSALMKELKAHLIVHDYLTKRCFKVVYN
jgi:hypothetical protein